MAKRYLKNKQNRKHMRILKGLYIDKLGFIGMKPDHEIDKRLSQYQIDDVVNVFPGESFNTAPVSYERFKEAYPEYLRRCMAHTK